MTAVPASLGGWVSGPFRWVRERWVASAATEVSLGARIAFGTMAGIAVLAVWLVAFGLGLSALQQHHEQQHLYSAFRSQLAEEVAPLGGAIARGAPVALLQSSAAGLNGLVVVEGSTSQQLRSGPGHLPGTPLPGQAGVSTILGRGTSFGGVFDGIASVHKGDTITVTTGQGIFTYVIQDVRRSGDPVPALPAGGGELTLVTAAGSGWRSGWAPTHTVFVDAFLQGKPQPTPPGGDTATSADQIMHGSSINVPALVLWIQLLALGAAGLIIGLKRWGRWQSWLIGAPVVIAALWGASSVTWQLLPNLL